MLCPWDLPQKGKKPQKGTERPLTVSPCAWYREGAEEGNSGGGYIDSPNSPGRGFFSALKCSRRSAEREQKETQNGLKKSQKGPQKGAERGI